MTSTIILTFCALMLIAYLFDLTSSITRIPSVILLLVLGFMFKQATVFLGYKLPNMQEVLPIFATLGLILIVLEGSLELELNRSKTLLITKSFFGSLLAILASATIFAFIFQYVGHYSFKQGLINAIPLCVISSSIAIPSVRNYSKINRQFVIYESSLSDIVGVIFFNFLLYNAVIDGQAFADFGINMLIILVISFVATIGLSLLLSKINHHIKFIPIILLIIVIYEILKVNNLPALIFILIFGLFLGNLDEISHFKFIKYFKPEVLNKEVLRFKDLTTEATFLIRTMFFLLFGYQIALADIINTQTLQMAIGVVFIIYIIRFLQLALSNLPILPLLFVAPRGLITILLFFSVGPNMGIPYVNNALITQVILLTAGVMIIGSILSKRSVEPEEKKPAPRPVNPALDA